jgi:hypothetical protein
MDQFGKKQTLSPEIEIKRPEKPKAVQEWQEQNIIRTVAENKKISDSVIDSKVRIVQDIFNMLERGSVKKAEESNEITVENLEEIMDKIKNDLRLEQPSIDDISTALTVSGLELQEVEAWLATNKSKLQSLVSVKEKLEIKSNDLLAQMTGEMRRNFFTKIFHGKKRRAISSQLEEASKDIAQTNVLLEDHQSRVSQIEASLREIFAKRQGLALNAAEKLFSNVLERYEQVKEELTSSAVKRELNDDLIAKKILPELGRLQSEKKISKEDAEEYIALLKVKLAEGNFSNWNDPLEKTEVFEERRNRLNELDKKSHYKLLDLGRRINSEGNEAADKYYDKIFDFLLRESAKENIEKIRDSLGGSLSPELQAKIEEITERVIYPYSDWRAPIEEREAVLDIKKIPSYDFEQLDGLERWQVVKDFSENSGVISKEVFSQVEKMIIQRLFDEKLFPGGRESWDGTAAAGKMEKIGNPEALPLMLRHIEASGSGHTNNAVVYIMERLLKESNPVELKKVLDSLPKKKKILLEILADENSYMSRFSKATTRYSTCTLLQNGDLTVAKEQLTKILDESGELDENKLGGFYFGQVEDEIETLEPLLKERSEVEKVIIDSKLGIWTQSADKLLAALVNPRNGESSSFPKRIAREGLNVSDEKILAVLDKIFEVKTFKKSGFEREAFLDGLVLLNSKENGKAVLETVLSAYSGARNDPARIRRIFQFLSTLDGLGEYGFVMPDKSKTDNLSQEIADLQNRYQKIQNKAERKKIKNRIEALNFDLQNLAGLKGIEDVMTQKVVEAVCRRIGLPQEYKDKIKNNLEDLLKNGVLEIIPSLAGRYEGKDEVDVQNLLKTITSHIIDDDFKSWRYGHEASEAQLAGLTEEQKEFWKETLEPVTIDIELPKDELNKREEELKAAQGIIKNAKEHILDFQPNFEFSKERVQMLAFKISELAEGVKLTTSDNEKKRLVLEKRAAQAERALIDGFLGIENASPRSFTKEKILDQARELREKITELNFPLAGLDMEQIEKIFTVGDVKSVTAFESDDALTLLRVGVEPQETCQSWRSGGFNECLLAYVADSNKKVINVADGNGKIVARSIVKLTNQRDQNDFESKTERKTLLVEKPYSLLLKSEVYRVFVRMLLMKAQALEASITFGRDFDEDTIQIFAEEARQVGYKMNKADLDVFIPRSLNKYEYSDILGGKISWFDRYQHLKAVTFENQKHDIDYDTPPPLPESGNEQ